MTTGLAMLPWDMVRATPRLLARAAIRLYRYTFSALIGVHCRHLPTCSCYADEAIGRFGLWAGGWMTLARLLRCHPLGTSGLDIVPERYPVDSRWYLPWRYGRWRGTDDGSRAAPEACSLCSRSPAAQSLPRTS